VSNGGFVRARIAAVFAAFLLAAGLAPAGAAQGGTYTPLTLTAETPKSAFADKESVTVKLAVENTSGKKLRFSFQEKDVLGKPLPYPAGLTVRVVDSQGQVLTQNDESRDEWWSSYLTLPSVTLARKASKDRLTLDPGDRIERTVDLRQVLGGLESIEGDLPAGSYTIQFALKGMKSNELQIDVGDARQRLNRPRRKP
jgi:hypothetical protein